MIEILKWALALVLTSCVATFLIAGIAMLFEIVYDWERAWTIAIQIVFWCWATGGMIVGLYFLWGWVGVV